MLVQWLLRGHFNDHWDKWSDCKNYISNCSIDLIDMRDWIPSLKDNFIQEVTNQTCLAIVKFLNCKLLGKHDKLDNCHTDSD